MIQTHSSTAQRTEPLRLAEAADGRENERYRLHRQAKSNPLKCQECGAPVHSGKGNDRWILCYPHAYLYGEWKEAARAKKKVTRDPKPPSGNTSLESLRRDSGLTRTALSRASGVGADTIRAFETGKTAYLKPATRKALWAALGAA